MQELTKFSVDTSVIENHSSGRSFPSTQAEKFITILSYPGMSMHGKSYCPLI